MNTSIEDNAPAHTRATRRCEEERLLCGIKKCEWPPNSPDLYAIEDLWGPEESLASSKLLKIKGASKVAHKNARLVIEQTWGSEELHELAISACEKWPDKLHRCIEKK